MGRKYVRDKAGRFAPKGGGTKGKGGKMGKSAKNVKARSTYKAASSKLRKKQSGIGINTSKGSAGHRKQIGGAKSGLTRVTNKLTNKRAAKSGLKKTLSSQRRAATTAKFKSKTTKGRAAKKEYKTASGKDRQGGRYIARKAVIKKQTGKKAYNAVDPKTGQQSLSRTQARPAGSRTKSQRIRGKIESKKVANKALRGSEFKGVKKRPATKKAAAAKKVTAAKKAQGTAKQRYKKAKTAAKTAERFSQIDRGTKEARKGAAAKGKFTKLKKSMSKGATKGKGYGLSKKGQEAKKRFTELKRERGGATKGKGTAAQKRAGIGYRKTQAALGKKTKGRTPKGRLSGGETLQQQMKAAPKQSFRGKGSKAKRRAAELAKKVPRTAKGAMAYDGPNKAASRARDRIIAKTKAKNAGKKKVKAPNAFSGTGKYSRQGKLSKASKGSGAKQKYKKATSELRKSKRGSSLYQQSQMGHPSKRKQGQVTRLTNKFTNRRAAKAAKNPIETGAKRVQRYKDVRAGKFKNPVVRKRELDYLKASRKLGSQLRNTKVKDPNRYVSPKELKRMKAQQLGTVGNKIVKFNRKKKR